jgi:hypothetical protein
MRVCGVSRVVVKQHAGPGSALIVRLSRLVGQSCVRSFVR